MQQQYTEIYITLKVVCKILTKLYKRSNVLNGNNKEAYIEAGGLVNYRLPGTIG